MGTFKIVVVLGAWCAAIAAQTAVVERQTSLRKDPSANRTPIATLLPDDKLTVLDSSSSPAYLKVKTADGKVGWVFEKFVETMAGPTVPPLSSPPPPKPVAESGGSAGTGSAPATTIDSSWQKPAAISKSFVGSEGTCADKGDGGDTATNLRKNRIDPLPTVHDVTWSAINSLAFPAAMPSRLSWTPAQLAQIKPFEGVALRLAAFLSHQVKVETEGRGESTNCHFTQPEDVDWHVYFTEHPNQPIAKAIIVETTPRARAGHTWDLKVLERWVNKNMPVRISGFLMLDPEHRDMIGSARSTVWEIHPIVKIEVCNSSSCGESDWADLDSVH